MYWMRAWVFSSPQRDRNASRSRSRRSCSDSFVPAGTFPPVSTKAILRPIRSSYSLMCAAIPLPDHRKAGALRVLDEEIALDRDLVPGPQEPEFPRLLRRRGHLRHSDRLERLPEERERVGRKAVGDPLGGAGHHFLRA